MLANHLQIPGDKDRFLSRLFPSVTSETTSEDISAALKRDTSKGLNKGVGLRDWRQVTVAFSRAHKDPNVAEFCGTDPDNEIWGQTNQVALGHYAKNPTGPAGIDYGKLRLYHQAAHWWWSLVGTNSFLFAQLNFTNSC